MARLLFVVGVGRSGTTLIQSILNAHPEMVSPPESHFVRKYVVDDVYRNPDKTIDLDEVAATLRECEDFGRLGVDVSEVMERFSEQDGAFTYARLFRETLDLYAADNASDRVAYIIEKDPSNSAYVGEVYSEFPDARILHIVRDPVDVLYSRINTEWGREWSFLRHVGTYLHQFRTARSYGQRLFGRRYKEVRYEELVRHCQRVCRDICAWLGLEYDRRMLSFQEGAETIVSEDEVAWKKRVFQPLSTDSIGKGRENLRGWRAKCAAAVSGEMRAPSSEQKAPTTRVWGQLVRAAGGIVRLRFLLARLTRRVRARLGASRGAA